MNPKTKERLLCLSGVTICLAVAGLSVLLEELIPGGLLGASIIALFMGTIINSFYFNEVPDGLIQPLIVEDTHVQCLVPVM